MLRRLFLLVTTVTLVGGLLPAAAMAGCASEIIVFSRAGVFFPDGNWIARPAVDTKVAGCALGADTRYIAPDATMVKVRYGADSPTDVLFARVWGLGIDRAVELRRAPLTTGGFVMDGPWIAIPPGSLGEINVEVTFPGGETDTETYRTIDR